MHLWQLYREPAWWFGQQRQFGWGGVPCFVQKQRSVKESPSCWCCYWAKNSAAWQASVRSEAWTMV